MMNAVDSFLHTHKSAEATTTSPGPSTSLMVQPGCLAARLSESDGSTSPVESLNMPYNKAEESANEKAGEPYFLID